jgi:hypothetical protein
MRTDVMAQRKRLRFAGTALLLAVSLGGCGLEEVDIPDLDGPSTYGQGVRVTASPDIILADGFSTSLVTANLFDQDGRPAPGRRVFMQVSNATGLTVDIGKLRSTGPDQGLGTGLVATADGGGNARVVYVAPTRTDFTTNGSVLVTARPMGEDAAGVVTHSVRIELRSAEPRLFPGTFACRFAVEPAAGPYRANSVVSFQNLSDGIRFEWYFGDGSPIEYGPDQAHVFRFPGSYQVTLVVTNALGLQSACGAALTVIP